MHDDPIDYVYLCMCICDMKNSSIIQTNHLLNSNFKSKIVAVAVHNRIQYSIQS